MTEFTEANAKRIEEILEDCLTIAQGKKKDSAKAIGKKQTKISLLINLVGANNY